MSDVERVEGEVVNNDEMINELGELREEVNRFREEKDDLRREIEAIRSDNAVLKELIIRMDLKTYKLME